MNDSLRQLLAPARLWPLATLLALGIIALALALCPAAAVTEAVGSRLVYANGAPVPEGSWSVLCIDGIAYLEIVSPHGHAVVPKVRKNGLVARCVLPEGE